MLALGYLTRYSGADATLGLAFARPRARTTEILRYVFLPVWPWPRSLASW